MVYKSSLAPYRYLQSQCLEPLPPTLCAAKFAAIKDAFSLPVFHSVRPRSYKFKQSSYSESERKASKRSNSVGASNKPSKRAVVATPCDDIRFDSIGHWPEPFEPKQRCRNCQSYSRVRCTKCKLPLCLVKERNCFLNFHSK